VLNGAFAGCWIERVLLQVDDPAVVVGSAVRCIRPGGVFAVFEPDWSSLTTTTDPMSDGWSPPARHPSVGATAGELLVGAGCTIHNRVEERSWWMLEATVRHAGLDRSTDAAIRRWVVDRSEQTDVDEFRAEMVKVLWVATSPG
jgi:hypothetical protein